MELNEITFSLASVSDDIGIRNLLNNTLIQGKINVIYKRDPNYFYSLTAQSKKHQTIIAKNTTDNKIIAVATNSTRSVYINGQISLIGYLSDLRIDKNYRKKGILNAGYKFLKSLYDDNKVDIYLASIIENNSSTERSLISKKEFPNLPKYNNLGKIITLLVKPDIRITRPNSNIRILKGSIDWIDKILECINKCALTKQFYPVHVKEDFFSNDGYLRDFSLDNFYIAIENNNVVGVIGKWDQSKFKQTEIITNINNRLRYFYLCFISILNDNKDIFQQLLINIYNDSIIDNYPYFIIGINENDPLLKVFDELPCYRYYSYLYAITYQEQRSFLNNIDTRIPYIELAMF